MQPYDNTPAGRDPELWRIARRRAKFQSQVLVYLVVNALLWVIWFFTDGNKHGIPWPVWSTVFWGFGVVMQGLGAYGAFGRHDLAEREYQRLTRQQ